MGEESPKPASTQTGAVFLSYASEDAAAAEQIAVALRVAGIEIWFDKSELRGGDVWDRMIRQRIRDCALFIPVISRHTQERLEGYFRLEWRLAVDRSQRMAAERTFIVPVVVDSTREREALVPDYFHEVQLTRLPAGETPPAFVERIQTLLGPKTSPPQAAATATGPGPTAGPSLGAPLPSARPSRFALWAVGVVAALINAVTGFHPWSKTYDRDLGDVLKLQTEIATSVAGALRVRTCDQVELPICDLDYALQPRDKMLHVEGALPEELHHMAIDRRGRCSDRVSVDSQEDVDSGERNALVAIHERMIVHEALV